ncbi:MAG: PAS domain S-box protein [Desulfuromonadaceae bacterium]|nr:PAS domain S-box protein [Desulfuromonadaceae bacterium]
MMPETTTISSEELAHLKERVRKLSQDKSHLQLINSLMNKVSAAQGLDNMITTLLSNILDVIGGVNIILYFQIDNNLFSADAYGRQMKLDRIDDELVRKAFEFRVPIENEHDFSDTRMLTPEFTKAYTWVFPLLADHELIGVIKLENLQISMRELYSRQPSFFSFVASLLKNEIHGRTRLKQANDHLREMNEKLELELGERKQIEEELIQVRNELEERVRKRTADLLSANEDLKQELAALELAQEEKNRYSEEIYDLYNNAPCGYHSLDENGMFIRMNATELQWLGYQEEEIIGKRSFADIITERSRQIFRDAFPRFKEQGWIKDLEFELVRKDGSILPVLLSATAITDPDGNFLMSRSTVYDITDRKMTEESEHLLSSIVESSDDAIISKDLNEVILSWNRGAERIYGYSPEEIIGKHISMLIPPGREGELPEIMTALKRGERIEHFTTERIRKDGQRIFVSLTVSPIRDGSGSIVRASVISRDITVQVQLAEQLKSQHVHREELIRERTAELLESGRELQDNQQALMNIVDDLNQKTDELEKANSKLRELDRLKSMFIASMSHELRTPLNSIIGFSSIIRDEWLGSVNPEQKENLDTIQRSGKHLLSLINDVIDVSKIEAGKIEAHFEEFDLYDLLTEAVQYVEKEIHEKGLVLKLQILHRQLCTDKRRLMQCVINLLSNAVKFTEHGEVTLSSAIANIEHATGPQQPSLTEYPLIDISIEDTGIGIAEEDISRLYLPFVRFDSSLKITVPGTGLGLYLTKKLVVEVLGGDIMCSSKIGVGSSFTLRIPERIYEKGTGSRG